MSLNLESLAKEAQRVMMSKEPMTKEQFLAVLGASCGIAVDLSHYNRAQPHPWPTANAMCIELNEAHERAVEMMGHDAGDPSDIKQVQIAFIAIANFIATKSPPEKSPQPRPLGEGELATVFAGSSAA